MITPTLPSIFAINLFFDDFEVEMTASVRALPRNTASHLDLEVLNTLMMFSSVGLLVTLLSWIEGIDVAAGIF